MCESDESIVYNELVKHFSKTVWISLRFSLFHSDSSIGQWIFWSKTI